MIRLGLIGQPVAHSRSPAIHQAFAAQAGLDIDYQLIECDADAVSDTIQRFFADGGQGLNVTLPHKAAAMAACQALSESARLAGAVNTLVPGDGGELRGDNTDGAGLIRDLKMLDAPLQGARIGVIGAGGAAQGIIKPLLDQQPASLVWSNRNPLKLDDIWPRYADFGPLRACANMALKGDTFDLLINATAAGHRNLCPYLPNGLLAADAMVYDLSYGPAATPFLDWASTQGASRRQDGFGMLLQQAALAFELWTGHAPDCAEARTALAD